MTFTTSGDVEIYDIEWTDINFDQSKRIDFEWTVSGDFSVNVHVHHNKFQSWGYDPSEYHNLDWDGIAPNTEDGQFSFFSESTPFPPEADFSSTVQIISPGETVTFFDESTGGPYTREWSFEPSNINYVWGTPASSFPTIEFTSEGLYTVTLTVSNENGTDSETKEDYIYVSTLIADFTPKPAQISVGDFVDFDDESIGDIISWNWEFEGGTPNYSSNQDPGIVSYYNTGTFNVSITVSDGIKTDDENGIVEVYSDDFFIVHMYVEPYPIYEWSQAFFTCEVIGGSGNFTYNWFLDGGLSTSTNVPEANWVYGYQQTYQAYVEVHDVATGFNYSSNYVTVNVLNTPVVISCLYLNGYTIQRGEQFEVYDCSAPNIAIDYWKIY